MQIADQIVQLVEPFAKVYNHSKVLSIGTTYVHLASMMGAGGVAIAADRTTLGLDAGDRDGVARHVAAQQQMHRWVVIGLSLSVITGVMMFAGDAETFIKSAWYWSKIGSVVLLLGNGLLLQRAEKALANDPSDAKAVGRLRLSAGLSLALWFVVALLGVIVKDAA